MKARYNFFGDGQVGEDGSKTVVKKSPNHRQSQPSSMLKVMVNRYLNLGLASSRGIEKIIIMSTIIPFLFLLVSSDKSL